MSVALRQQSRSKLLSLGLGEFASVAVFLVIGAAVIAPGLAAGERVAFWAALGVLALVLVQAGTYWLLARRWVLRSRMPSGEAALFRVLRVVDVGLLAVAAVVVLVFWPERILVAILVAGVWLFALLEYLNYFVVRLSYPVGRWFAEVGRFRRPRLVEDLRRSASASAEASLSSSRRAASVRARR